LGMSDVLLSLIYAKKSPREGDQFGA